MPGIPVTFSTAGSADQFTYVPGKTRYKDPVSGEIRTATSTKPANPAAAADLIAYTDSNGEAYAHYQFDPDETDSEVITVSVADTTASTTFEPEIEASTKRPTLDILSGNNQRTDSEGDIKDPLIVIVKKEGNLLPSELVTFRTVKGTLRGRNLANNADASGKRVYGTTDGSGEAEVEYFQDPGKVEIRLLQ